MRRRSQVTLRGLCLLLPALATLACRDEPDQPVGQDPAASLPLWARCENWRRANHSCDQTTLLADHEECVRTEGEPDRQRLLAAGVGGMARRRAVERKTIVCLEQRGWMMKPAGLRNLPGRPPQAAPPS